jgi:XapX domain-containing protein
MKPYILSLLGGLLAGAIYSLIRVRSPAPPIVALLGLLGMVIGTQIIPMARQLLANSTLPVGKPEVLQTHTTQPHIFDNAKLIPRAPSNRLSN